MRIILLFFLTFALFAADPVPVVISFSDGSKAEGTLSMMGARPLYLNEDKSSRSRDRKLELSDLMQLTQTVESASMERPWMFKESGKTEKVYFEGEYPFVNFSTEILLVNGDVLRGHIISAAFRFKGNSSSKLFLTRQIKGRVGEKMDELKYIVKIEFKNRAVKKTEPIRGTVSGYGKLLQATAVDPVRHVVLHAEVKGDSFVFSQPLSARYDLFLLTDEAAFSGFEGKNEWPETLSRNLELADDFFKDRFLLKFDGSRTLVYKRRADFYDAKKHVNGGFLWHLEIWNWHPAGNEWKLDSRDIALRHKNLGTEKKRKLFFMKSLSGVVPGTQKQVNKETPYEFIRILE